MGRGKGVRKGGGREGKGRKETEMRGLGWKKVST